MMNTRPPEPQRMIQQLKILPRSSLILLIILVGIIQSLIFWGFFSWIPIKTMGNGITLSKEGLYQVTAKSDGIITALHVKTGQEVKEGDLLVDIENKEIDILFQSTQAKLNNLKNEYQRLSSQIQIEATAREHALNRAIEATQYAMNQTEQRIKSLNYEIERRHNLYKKGLISGALIKVTESEIVQEEINIETVKAELASLNIELSRGYREEELSNKEWEIQDAERDLAILKAKIQDDKIFSTVNGRVVALETEEMRKVSLGDELLVIESHVEKQPFLTIRGYFSVENGADIVKGTPVEITFPHLLENEYGSMRGVVEHVSEFAISTESLFTTIYNHELIKTLLGNSSAVIEIIVLPLKNPEHPNEFLWTTPFPPAIEITTGTLCTLQATIEERRPLYFIFPLQSFKIKPIITLDQQ